MLAGFGFRDFFEFTVRFVLNNRWDMLRRSETTPFALETIHRDQSGVKPCQAWPVWEENACPSSCSWDRRWGQRISTYDIKNSISDASDISLSSWNSQQIFLMPWVPHQLDHGSVASSIVPNQPTDLRHWPLSGPTAIPSLAFNFVKYFWCVVLTDIAKNHEIKIHLAHWL